MKSQVNLIRLAGSEIPVIDGVDSDVWVVSANTSLEDCVIVKKPRSKRFAVPLFEIEGQARSGLTNPSHIRQDLNLWFEGAVHGLIRGVMREVGVEAPTSVVVRYLDRLVPGILVAHIGIVYGDISTSGRGPFTPILQDDWGDLDREVVLEPV